MKGMRLKSEEAKIACAGKFFEALEARDTKFHVTYKQIATYADLLAKVN